MNLIFGYVPDVRRRPDARYAPRRRQATDAEQPWAAKKLAAEADIMSLALRGSTWSPLSFATPAQEK